LEFAGERVRSVAQLRRLVHETPAGRSVNVQVSRGGQIKNLSVKLEQGGDAFGGQFRMQGPAIHIPPFEMKDFNFHFVTGGGRLGISGDELTSQLASYFGVKQGKGVLVREVSAGSAAEKAGLKAGDVIVQANGKSVASVSDLREAMSSDSSEEHPKVNLTIVRNHNEQALTVELERSQWRKHREVSDGSFFDPEEISRMAADSREAAKEVQESVLKMQKDLQTEQQQWNGEWRQQLRDQQRELQMQQKQLHEQMKKARDLAYRDNVI
jgi:hypothetical protein